MLWLFTVYLIGTIPLLGLVIVGWIQSLGRTPRMMILHTDLYHEAVPELVAFVLLLGLGVWLAWRLTGWLADAYGGPRV